MLWIYLHVMPITYNQIIRHISRKLSSKWWLSIKWIYKNNHTKCILNENIYGTEMNIWVQFCKLKSRRKVAYNCSASIRSLNMTGNYDVSFSPWLTVREIYFDSKESVTCDTLTHWSRVKMATISQTMFSNAFSRMKMSEFRLKCHWSLFLSLLTHIYVTRPQWVNGIQTKFAEALQPVDPQKFHHWFR